MDDSHLHVILLRCPRCGLELASVFSEQIDWCDGNDPQYWCLVPLAPGEAKQLAGAANPDALTSLLATFATDRRVLHRDCPKGGPCGTFWRPGLRVI